MMMHLGIVALVLQTTTLNTLQNDSLRETILSEEKKVVEAIKQKDTATLKELLAHEVYSVTPDGGRLSGAEKAKSLESFELAAYSISDAQLVEVTDDVAILTYKFTMTVGPDVRDSPTTTLFATSTWAKRDGRWMAVFYQETPTKD